MLTECVVLVNQALTVFNSLRYPGGKQVGKCCMDSWYKGKRPRRRRISEGYAAHLKKLHPDFTSCLHKAIISCKIKAGVAGIASSPGFEDYTIIEISCNIYRLLGALGLLS